MNLNEKLETRNNLLTNVNFKWTNDSKKRRNVEMIAETEKVATPRKFCGLENF